MQKLIQFCLRFVVFWLILFNLHRVVFLLFNSSYIQKAGIGEVLLSFWYSLALDISAASYFLVLPLLFYVVFSLLQKPNWFAIFLKVYTGIILFFVALLHGGDLAVYPEWQNKVSFKVLEHLAHPTEALFTATMGYFMAFLITTILQIVFGWWVFKRLVLSELEPDELTALTTKLKLLGVFILVAALVAIGIRGGVGELPVSVSSAYYADEAVLNDASVNTTWSFVNNVAENLAALDKNALNFYPIDEACNTRNRLYDYDSIGVTLQILDTSRPNIVLLILESWQADVIEANGGLEGLTPQFDQLMANGLYFNNFYGNAHTSDKGNAALLAGFPGFPWASVITQPAKYRNIPSINEPLQELGYTSSYLYGGQLIYANIKGFLTDHGFNQVKDYNDFKGQYPEGSLGIHDQYMLTEFGKHLSEQQQPFMSCLFTLSTHAPYDIPYNPDTSITWGKQFNDYLITIKYTDAELGQFFKRVKTEPWYDNTLFILVADHGHATPRWYDYRDARRFKIPLLFYGEVLQDSLKGRVIEKLGSQIDLAATLLPQMGLSADAFEYSKNLLNSSTPEFAPYSFHNGFGWIRPDCWWGYELSYKAYFPDSFSVNPDKLRLEQEGKSFFQCTFQEFLAL